ncbi:MAG: transposase, partial [Chloroflexota bacterium]|nr:transposase [Chloroflexota bacterium]
RPLRADQAIYAPPNVVERRINWLKRSRGLAACYEQWAVTCWAMVTIAPYASGSTRDSSDRP